MQIRKQTDRDSAAVYRLIEAAFGQKDEAELVLALTASDDAVISLVVEEDSGPVGHILFSRLRAPDNCLALAPVSVLPDRQNRGAGSALIRAGIERARSGGWDAIFVLGEPDYYTRFGFDAAAADHFETPYQGDYFMVLALNPGFLATRAGAVIYPAPFLNLE